MTGLLSRQVCSYKPDSIDEIFGLLMRYAAVLQSSTSSTGKSLK